jgi:hypothetical protein
MSQTHYTSRITHYLSGLNSKYTIFILLFLLALISRLADLGRFLTADEFLWVDRSRNFLAGLTNRAYQCDSVVEQWNFVAEGLACTLRTGHPGVTTMWTGSFGFVLRWLWDGRPGPLHDYVVAVSTNPLDAGFIAWERLGTVLITSSWVIAVYWLLRRLFGTQVALVAAIFMALNPFHIALSRVIHHDALGTTFTTLSVLCAFIYWGEQGSRRWLFFSGIAAGLAFISKIASLFLMPFIALTGLWFLIQKVKGTTRFSPLSSLLSPLGLTILDGLLWFAIAVATVFIIWPALWVAPVETFQTVFLLGFKYTTGAHAKGNFLLGQASSDPGVLFYPVTWLYRTTPLILVGIVGIVIAGLSAVKQRKASPALAQFFRYLPLLLIFIVGYMVMLSIGQKKQERYFLPAYPWFDLIAAAGLISILSFAHSYLTRYFQPSTRYAIRNNIFIVVFAVLMVNGSLVIIHYPYYFTYYNPLLGGGAAAEQAVTVGWGEGLDLAAGYLNQKANADEIRVASWYQSTFAPFYQGQAISYSKEKGKVLAGDYAIFYINQTQRRFPDEVLFEYFEGRFKPEKVIPLRGINYAWIYPSLGVDHYVEDQTYTGIASLLAWQWAGGDIPLIPGRPRNFELYWEYLGKQPGEAFFFRLVDQQGRAWAEGQSQLAPAENPPQAQWREGEILVERGAITPPRDMPPGQYRLQIGFYTHAPAVPQGELLFDLPPPEALIAIGHAHEPTFALPTTAIAIHQPLGDSLMLLGATLPAEPIAPGDAATLDLIWRVEQPLSAAAELHLGLMAKSGEAQQAWFNLTLAETFNAAETIWQPGDIIHTRWRLDVLPNIPPGDYNFELVLPENIEFTLPLEKLVIK